MMTGTSLDRLADGLILSLPLDEIVDGTVVDTSGQDRGVVVEGDPRIVPDALFTRCMEFDGTDDALSVRFTPDFHLTGALTIALWARPHTDGHFWLPLIQYPRFASTHRRPYFDYGMFLGWGRLHTRIAGDHVVPLSEPVGVGRWTHLAITWDGPSRTLTYFVDGVPTAVRGTAASSIAYGDENPLLIGRNASGGRRFHGRLARVRVYERALTSDEIRLAGDEDRLVDARFVDEHPLRFSARDDDDEPTLSITGEHTPGRNLHLAIVNRSDFAVRLDPPPKSSDGTPATPHFEVRFRPGTLAPHTARAISLLDHHWHLDVDETTDTLRLAHRTGLTLDPGHRIALTLGHVRADPALGARSTRVELHYADVGTDPGRRPIDGYLQEHLSVHSRVGRKTIPLRLGYLGSHTILNDGSENTLTLYIGNTSKNTPLALRSGDPASRFVLSFDCGDEPWALATSTDVAAVDVKPPAGFDRDLRSSGERVEWVLTPREDMVLGPGEQLRLELSKLKSQAPSGIAHTYLTYDNIPGYWDGELTCEVEKAPIVYRGDADGERAGIGTASPDATLDVAGRIAATALDVVSIAVSGDGAGMSGHVEAVTMSSGTIGSGTVTSDDIRDSYGRLVPSGVIVMWSGDRIPAGWRLCNGEHGTPDLRSRFVVGVQAAGDIGDDYLIPRVPDDEEATDTYGSVGNRGGADSVELTVAELPSHGHGVSDEPVEQSDADSGESPPNEPGEHTHSIEYEGPQSPVDRGPYVVNKDVLGKPVGSPEKFVMGTTNTFTASTPSGGTHSHSYLADSTGGDESHENRPPFYVLAFIMKIEPVGT